MSNKILIVDDDIDSLKLIGLMLQRQGYEVIAASAGNQALAKATSENPSLIILDVMMPDMDGYEVCRRLRANPDTKAIPIIMFTAKTLVDDKVAGFEAGADDYLTKPTHPAELASRVKNILARSGAAIPNGPRRGDAPKGISIGVIGAKGGVGTTTLALNLAAAFVLAGQNSIVADFRLGAGNLGHMLGFPNNTGMANVLSKPTADIRPPTIDTDLINHQTGLRALACSTRTKEALLNYPIDSAVGIIRALRMMGRPVIFDLGPGLNANSSRLQREMDFVILVVEPNPVALSMAREMLPDLDASGNNRTHIVVVNRAQSNIQTPWHEVEQLLGKELRAIFSAAHDHLFQSMRAAMPIVTHQPNAVISTQFVKLAEDMNQQIRAANPG
ncbi:MAG TPA: response regulator [Aggregatilineales bacterium]|nr:response regulator [Anaerolineae bacterium]HUN10146.1 response regulator [Aggregatilineales bacterium]